MTIPDYRAALAELVEAVYADGGFSWFRNLYEVANRARTALAQPEPEGDRLFHWRNLGDGKPIQVQECPLCGIAPANVDDCGRFGDPACPYFGVGKPEPEGVTDKALASFTAYFCRNYPGPDTIIHKPEWHAPKIFHAAADAIARWARPALKPVPVSERFEFSVFDSEYEEQAGGTAPTYSQALSEGQHYLAMYSQDGLHSLELRRVEVLPHHAMPVPEVTP